MAMNDNIFPVVSQPGIQRDGTTFDSDSYIDGQWCRFYRGKPQKIGGYIEMFGSQTNVPRGVFIVPQAQNSNIYVGDASSLEYRTVDNINGNPVGLSVDRTPLLFVTSQSNQWSFDIMYDTTYNQSTIVAMANQNLLSIDQPIERPIYYGPANTIDPLIETGFSTSGGFVSLHPYLLIYGNDGNVRITNANDPTTLLRDSSRVTGSKIVAGLPCRAGQNSPACLLWSLDSLIRVTSVGTSDVEFSYDTISAECSILSSNSAIEYNGNFYWVGIDTFYFYNGVIQEWPNSMSLEYFFDNLNFVQRQKVWVSKVTRYGEIWIFYPHGNATECNRALVYCVREKTWYDTDINRSCGDYNTIFNKPVWADNKLDLIDNDYPIWRHEVGVDSVSNGVHTAIHSYFEMSVISYTAVGPGGQNLAMDKSLYAYSFEPDFAPAFNNDTGISTGDMTLIVNGREFPNSIINNGNEPIGYTFNNDTESINFETKIDLREKRRLMTLRFDSNTVGGNYKMGKCLLVPKMGDSRP